MNDPESATTPPDPATKVSDRRLSRSEVLRQMKIEEIGRQGELTAALIRAKLKFPSIEKDKLVDYPMKNSDKRVTFRFATLPNILSAVTEPLAQEGLLLVGRTTGTKVIQDLEHTSGSKRHAWLKLPDMNDAMSLQEELSKRRRYMIMVLLTLAIEDSEEKDKRQRRGTSRVRGQATPAVKPRGATGPTAASHSETPREPAKPTSAGTAKPSGPPPRNDRPPNAQTQPQAQSPENGPKAPNSIGQPQWMYEDNPTSLALKEVLPTLRPEQAAKLRQQYNNDPEKLLAEARKLHDAVYGNQEEPPQNSEAQDKKGSLEERITDAFDTLGMNTEQQQALRTEYHKDDKGLFEHLKRAYLRKQ